MIFDLLENARLYSSLGPRFQAAFKFLASTALEELPPGRRDIDGDQLFALVNDYSTQPLEACRFESHQKYADVQLMVRGQERMGIVMLPNSGLTITEPYHAERDVVFYSGSGDLLTMTPGRFTIFFPHDAHQP